LYFLNYINDFDKIYYYSLPLQKFNYDAYSHLSLTGEKEKYLQEEISLNEEYILQVKKAFHTINSLIIKGCLLYGSD